MPKIRYLLPAEISGSVEISADPKFWKSSKLSLTPLFPIILTLKLASVVPFKDKMFHVTFLQKSGTTISKIAFLVIFFGKSQNHQDSNGTRIKAFWVRKLGKRGVINDVSDFKNFGSVEISDAVEISTGNICPRTHAKYSHGRGGRNFYGPQKLLPATKNWINSDHF